MVRLARATPSHGEASTNATGYTVSAAGQLGSSIGTTSTTSFVDSTVVLGTTYYYAVSATGPGGVSPPSSQDAGNSAPTTPGPVTVVLQQQPGGYTGTSDVYLDFYHPS